ncbi:MAG: nitroreductase family protein [Clostridiaceae bacterium]|nr:nitroreductase family protein [Eubacteriales bacterium]
MDNGFFDLLDSRVTCRSFLPDPIPQDVMDDLMRAMCSAPSGGNFQNVSVIVVTDTEKKNVLSGMSRNQGFIAKAPANIVFCMDHRRQMRLSEFELAPKAQYVDTFDFLMGFVDASICAQTFLLAAEAKGLKCCFNGNVLQSSSRLSELLALPKYVVPVVMVTVGYPRTSNIKHMPKYGSDVMVHYNEYKDMEINDLYAAYSQKCGGEHFRLQPAKLDKVYATAQRLYGKEWADKCIAAIERQGYLSSLQYWLGCFYSDNAGNMNHGDYRAYYNNSGFSID